MYMQPIFPFTYGTHFQYVLEQKYLVIVMFNVDMEDLSKFLQDPYFSKIYIIMIKYITIGKFFKDHLLDTS